MKDKIQSRLSHTPQTLIFLVLHLSVLLVFVFPFKWWLVALCLGSYAIRMFGITAGYHRYFSHRSYKTSRIFQFVLAWLGSAAVQNGVLWWAGHHRWHHRFADQDADIHSPSRRGFWWSHIGWILVPDYNDTRTDQVRDLSKFPELVWLNRYHFLAPTSWALLMLWIGGWPGVVWGFCVSTVLLSHATFMINSLAHVYGTRRFETNDTSKNNFWLSVLTLGEGWHNNHHHAISRARQGLMWWEIDVTYCLLKFLETMNVVHDLR